MVKTEFEEDDEGLPDTLGDLDVEEEEEEEKAPVNGVKQPAPKAKKAESKAEPKKEVSEAETQETPEQQAQNLILNIINRIDDQEERIRNLEAMFFRLKQI